MILEACYMDQAGAARSSQNRLLRVAKGDFTLMNSALLVSPSVCIKSTMFRVHAPDFPYCTRWNYFPISKFHMAIKLLDISVHDIITKGESSWQRSISITAIVLSSAVLELLSLYICVCL